MIGLIFSRDRAMQLDGTLSSFFLHCKDYSSANITVLYKTTNHRHARQYTQLEKEYSRYNHVRFIKETDFRRDTLSVMMGVCGNAGPFYPRLQEKAFHSSYFFFRQLAYLLLRRAFHQTGHVLFLVDDNIFVWPFLLSEIKESLRLHKNAWAFSLRLGRNTHYCYSESKEQKMPRFKGINENVLKYKWSKVGSDFGYHMDISSSVYRLRDILPLLMIIPFENPNTLEGNMVFHKWVPRIMAPYLLCYDQSVTFCNPVNIVQDSCNNRAGSSSEHSSDHLARLFDEGFRIDPAAYSGFVPNACHQEHDLIFRQR